MSFISHLQHIQTIPRLKTQDTTDLKYQMRSKYIFKLVIFVRIYKSVWGIGA